MWAPILEMTLPQPAKWGHAQMRLARRSLVVKGLPPADRPTNEIVVNQQPDPYKKQQRGV